MTVLNQIECVFVPACCAVCARLWCSSFILVFNATTPSHFQAAKSKDTNNNPNHRTMANERKVSFEYSRRFSRQRHLTNARFRIEIIIWQWFHSHWNDWNLKRSGWGRQPSKQTNGDDSMPNLIQSEIFVITFIPWFSFPFHFISEENKPFRFQIKVEKSESFDAK